jgi:uncharacterized LabA/DUF88 family protein
MNDRVAIFIDGAYAQRIVADEFNRVQIDFGKMADSMAGSDNILRTYYYNCLPYQSRQPTEEEKNRYDNSRRFYHALAMLPRFEVRLVRLEFRGTDNSGNPIFEQKRVDILLGVDLVQLAAKGHIQTAILLAGDSDFVPAVAVAKSEGVLVRLFHGTNCHTDLLREVDERVRIDQGFVNTIMRTPPA